MEGTPYFLGGFIQKAQSIFENLYKGQPAFSMIILLNKKRQKNLLYVNYGHEAKGFLEKKKALKVQLCRAVVS